METTNRFFSGLAATRARLAMLAATLVAATIGLIAPAMAAVSGLTVGGQTGSLYAGTPGSVTYGLELTRNSSYPSNSSVLNWSVASLPAGASATFAPVGGWGGVPSKRAYTMTVNTTNAVAVGSYPFTVSVSGSVQPTIIVSATGTLVVQAVVQAAQTISFGAIADRTVVDPSFTVNATASSGLPVSFAAIGDCTVMGSTVTLGTPATLPGTCAITASQAGNASYLAAADVQQTFAITAANGTPSTFDLYATTGTATLAGTAVPVWGYNTSNASVTKPGGPTLTVNQGDTVTVALHNGLDENTAILFQGQAMVPDTTGAAPGTAKVYTFVASKPGTFLYEAGLLPRAQHQVPMGLYGALVVRPTGAPLQAYTDASTAFNNEQVLVLSEVDPALNASPSTFDMRDFKPSYFLINGTVYPDTPLIGADESVLAGNKVLLRYVNAGAKHHSMATLGARQWVIGEDGSALQFPRTLVAKTIAPGQTADAIVTVPAAAQDGSKFAVYDGNLMLHNGGVDNAFGGMMTFVKVAGTPAPADTTGPVASGLAYAAGTLTATVSDVATGNSNVSAAEYRLDSNAAAAMTGTFGAPSVNVSATVSVPVGAHTLYVRGQDSAGNWGAFASLAVNGGDNAGPTNSALALTPNPSNGSADVMLTGTASDAASGGSNITAAQYTIDGGAQVAMTLAAAEPAAPVRSVTATIPAATVNGLSQGTHVVSVTSTDFAGNTGAAATINLIVDKTAPATSGVTATPNPTNGTPLAVRVKATVTDGVSNVAAAEGFIDAVGATGSGFPLLPTDGQFNALTESVFADIPLPTIAALSGGDHTIFVRGKDAAGNWGATSPTVLVMAMADARSFNASGANGNQTQNYNTNATSLRANDFPRTNATTTALVSAPVRTGGAGTVTPFLTCTSGTGAPAVGTSTICTNGRFTVNLPNPGGNNAAQMAGRRGTYTFTYTITSGGVTSLPATVTITVN